MWHTDPQQIVLLATCAHTTETLTCATQQDSGNTFGDTSHLTASAALPIMRTCNSYMAGCNVHRGQWLLNLWTLAYASAGSRQRTRRVFIASFLHCTLLAQGSRVNSRLLHLFLTPSVKFCFSASSCVFEFLLSLMSLILDLCTLPCPTEQGGLRTAPKVVW